MFLAVRTNSSCSSVFGPLLLLEERWISNDIAKGFYTVRRHLCQRKKEPGKTTIQAGLSPKYLEDFMPIDLENRTFNTLIDLYI